MIEYSGVGMEQSDRADRKVTTAEGEKLAAELGMPFIETSAKTAQCVEDAFVQMARTLIQMRARAATGSGGGDDDKTRVAIGGDGGRGGGKCC